MNVKKAESRGPLFNGVKNANESFTRFQKRVFKKKMRGS